MTIQIEVTNKRATVVGEPVIVCGNSGDRVQFLFDDEWGEDTEKTALFAYERLGVTEHVAAEINGDTAEIPVLPDIRAVKVGAYEGDIRATTPAVIPCEPSVRYAEDLAAEDDELFERSQA